ncbi:hypothetical protein Dda_8747 [Drechslerella dactyloides]|uniref:DUF8004 domain-containing protein n=1 Tax=Drechslerella dactyloides TaxID=74499 RepID=A0AAD6IR56_DREDA|nr:hypothetical protein Dda_8747 [Drechslerella dactyloides]
MAQRSARARSKLDKISSGGVAKFGHGGLATPATSTGSPSLSSFSSRSFGRTSSNQKSVFRSFIDSKSDKIRGTLAEKISPVATKPKLDLEIESVPTLKRWEGGGRPASPWNGLSRRDPELWFPDGDTLVYLSDKFSKSKEDQPFRQPSFRIRSSVLRATNSPFLIGSLYDYDDLPQSPSSISSSLMSADQEINPMQPNQGRELEGIAHELHFPAPRSNDRLAIYRHHATTRNFFALLFNRSLVGSTFGQTLLDLAERMDLYMPPGHDNVEDLLRYLTRKEFDDVRNVPDLAAGMLIFAEKYRLADLYKESFVHCVGMMNRLELSLDYQQISPITRAHLDRANLNIQVRTDKCDNLLVHGQFAFNDIWPHMSAGYPPARHAFDRFQKFLVKHYQNRFGSWPPAGEKFGRLLYQQLQRDFDALYDFLVDKDVMWEPAAPSSSSASTSSTHRATGAHKLMNPYKQEFRADDNSLQFTDILLSFDRSNKYPHIPHPYPLVPEVKTTTAIRTNKQSNFFGKRTVNTDKTIEKENALALIQATNLDALYTSPNNSLVAAYQLMEKSDRAIEIDPHDARKGRWLLIYAILQTLATITVDAPDLKWTENVDYFLCAPLKGLPPWEQQPQSSRSGEEDDFCQYRSHCWTVPFHWNSQSSAKSLREIRSITDHQVPRTDDDIFPERAELDASSIQSENHDYIDGRPPKRRTPVASFASSSYIPTNLGRSSLQSRNSRTSLHSTHSHSTPYRSGLDDLGIGPGILEKDDFEPGALESLNVLGMNNLPGGLLAGVSPALAMTQTSMHPNPNANGILNNNLNNFMGPQMVPNTVYDDDDGSSDADDEDDDVDIDMEEEHDPGHFLAVANPRASNVSNATKGSRESGAAGMYAPWGGVGIDTR